MKLKVNIATGMVALVAGDNIMNQKPGVIFGVLPKDAARLISQDAAIACKDLPEDAKFSTVEINAESGQVLGMETNKDKSESSPSKAEINKAVKSAKEDAEAAAKSAKEDADELLAAAGEETKEANDALEAANAEIAALKAAAAKS